MLGIRSGESPNRVLRAYRGSSLGRSKYLQHPERRKLWYCAITTRTGKLMQIPNWEHLFKLSTCTPMHDTIRYWQKYLDGAIFHLSKPKIQPRDLCKRNADLDKSLMVRLAQVPDVPRRFAFLTLLRRKTIFDADVCDQRVPRVLLYLQQTIMFNNWWSPCL